MVKGGPDQCRTGLQTTNFSLVMIQVQLSNLVVVLVVSYRRGKKRRILLLGPSSFCVFLL